MKHQSSVSLAFVRGIHRWPANSPHKGLVTQKMFPFDDVIMRNHMTTLNADCSSIRHVYFELKTEMDRKTVSDNLIWKIDTRY